MNRRQLLQTAISLPALASGAEAAYYPPPDSGGGWRARKPDARQLAKFDEALECAKGSTKHGGLLVAHQGWLIYEKYFGLGSREATPNAASCGKAFTSVALGILLGERPDLFPSGLDQKVFTPRYLPEEAFPLDDPAKADIKLGQLLAMTAGLAGNNPAYVRGQEVKLTRTGADGWQAMVDHTALTTPLWTKPGGGYCYATAAPHIVSIILRRLTGIELQSYLEEKVARPLGWGRWGFAYRRAEVTHTPGGGGIAIRATDMLRFAYLLLCRGRWAGRQIVPAWYVRHCGRRSPYNPHYSYSLQFNVNTGGDLVPGAPRDAFWKGGSGGHCFYVVPSLDLVIYKLGGRDEQYNPALNNVPPPPEGLPPYDGSRELWKQPRPEPDATSDVLRLVTEAFRP